MIVKWLLVYLLCITQVHLITRLDSIGSLVHWYVTCDIELCLRLLRLQWKQDIDEAVRLITKAMQIDDKCEFAYETLGTIEVQRLF